MNEVYIVFNTRSLDIELVPEFDATMHKLITTKKELAESAASLMDSKPIGEVVIDLAVAMAGKMNLREWYADFIWKSLQPIFKDLPAGTGQNIFLPVKLSTRKILGLTDKHVNVLLGRLDDLGALDRQLKTRILNCLHAANINYVWELSLYYHGNFSDLLKFRDFGHKTLSNLQFALSESLGEEYTRILDSLEIFLNEILKTKCQEISALRTNGSYEYLKTALNEKSFSRLNQLEDVYHGLWFDEKDLEIGSGAKLPNVKEAMELLQASALRLITEAIFFAAETS